MPEILHAELITEAKSLLRSTKSAALGTLRAGAPFTTLTTYATDYDGTPVLLLSTLAAHTQNLANDPRCSLLVARTGKGDPLTHPRLTISGLARPDNSGHLRARFLARNPKAKLYAGFADFSFYRLEVSDFHLNGGFARAADFAPAEILTPVKNVSYFAAGESAALHMLNHNLSDTLRQTVARLTQSHDQTCRALSLDPGGIDIVCGEATLRLPVKIESLDQDELEVALKAL